MKEFRCTNCGATAMAEEGRYMFCVYCGSKFLIQPSDIPQQSAGMSLRSDIEILLEKCQKEPHNARKYANLILDIDPLNKAALRYL